MPDSMDKLNKLAAEEREKKPFAKIDKMEKDLNLDQLCFASLLYIILQRKNT